MVVILLSPSLSLFISLIFAFGFVFSLYIWPNSTASRDSPKQIIRRFISITIWSILCTFIMYYLCINESEINAENGRSFLTWIGLPTFDIYAILYPLLLTATLFLGPLYNGLLKNIENLYNGYPLEFGNDTTLLIFLRNIIIGPLLEEYIFRCFICILLISGGFKLYSTILLSPLLFGIAHLHHLIDHVRNRGISLKQAILIVCFQLCYTTLFGLYASYVFIITGNFITIFLLHSFCNFMELPDLSFNSNGHPRFKNRISIWFAYIIGIIGFYYYFNIVLNGELYDSWPYLLANK